jgi:hypothetical protein
MSGVVCIVFFVMLVIETAWIFKDLRPLCWGAVLVLLALALVLYCQS